MTAEIEVIQDVKVEVPDGFFTPEFMEEFRRYFYDFASPQEHMQHLAQLYARGLVDNDSFIEGYGQANEIGIKFDGKEVA